MFIFPKIRTFSIIVLFFATGIFFETTAQTPSNILALAESREKTVIEGTVLGPPKYTGEMSRFDLRSRILFLKGNPASVNENIRVNVYSNPPSLNVGDRIRFPCRLKPFRNFNNPGRYNYEKAMSIQGFKCSASVSDGRYIVPMGAGQLSFPERFIEHLQRPVRDFLAERLKPEDASLFRALLLGERQAISLKQREPFNETGLGHVLAVSGLHIGLIAWSAFIVFKFLFSLSTTFMLKAEIRKIAAIFSCIFVIWYTCLAGFQVSTQRAMIMVLAFLWSLIIERENEVWSTLSLAALVVLALDPHCLFSISFQLSFTAVIGILWLTPVLLEKIPMPGQTKDENKTILARVYVYFIGLIAVSLCVNVFLLPITSFYFHRISLVAIPANVTVVPLLGLWVIPSGLLSAIALPFSHSIAGALLTLSSLGLHLANDMIRFWADMSWAYCWVLKPNMFEIFLFYSTLFCVFFFRRKIWAKAGVFLLFFLILIDTGYWVYRTNYNRDLRVRFFDVGQANAALVEFPLGKKMLIDGGGFPGSDFDVGKMVIAPSLWHSKIRKIDYIVLSHPQADHMNGLPFVARAFKPDEFWHNGQIVEKPAFSELISVIGTQNIRKRVPKDLSEDIWINGARIQLLHPRSEIAFAKHHDSFKGLNNNSLVLKITYAGKSFLFPGDIEREAERYLSSKNEINLKSDILLCPHHGSRT
ncbi:DNA internalization-related competence protein ComEC/Rec2, partial [Thermodesulfobacteriota bacterium]